MLFQVILVSFLMVFFIELIISILIDVIKVIIGLIKGKTENVNRVIYIIGQSTRYNIFYFFKFFLIETYLDAIGFTVINPAKINFKMPKMSYDSMLHVNYALIDLCPYIYLLKNYNGQDSKTHKELAYAKEHNKHIIKEGATIT